MRESYRLQNPNPIALPDGNHSRNAVSPLVQGKDQCSFKRRGVESAGSMTEMMIKTEDALPKDSVHFAQSSATVQLQPELTHSLSLVICSVDGGNGCEFGLEPSLSKPRANGTTGHGDNLDVTPVDSCPIQAEASSRIRNTTAAAGTNQLTLFDRRLNSVSIKQRCSGIV